MEVAGDELPVEKLQGRDVLPELMEPGAGVGQQVDAVALALQLLHQIVHPVQGRYVLVPVVQNVPHRLVEPLRQAGAHRRHHLVVGDGAPVHPHPLDGAEQLPAHQLVVRRIGDKPGGVVLRVKPDQHTAHVKHNVLDHTIDTFPLLALNTTISRMPLVTVRMEARDAAVPTELRTMLV